MDGTRFVVENSELDSMQVQFIEGETKRQSCGLVAVPFAPVSRITQANGHPADLVRPFDAAGLDETKQSVAVQQVNGERECV